MIGTQLLEKINILAHQLHAPCSSDSTAPVEFGCSWLELDHSRPAGERQIAQRQETTLRPRACHRALLDRSQALGGRDPDRLRRCGRPGEVEDESEPGARRIPPLHLGDSRTSSSLNDTRLLNHTSIRPPRRTTTEHLDWMRAHNARARSSALGAGPSDCL
jgi:hypothetical protein